MPIPISNTSPALSDDATRSLLERLDFFYGVSFDGPNGPYKSSRRVARVGPDPLSAVQVHQDIATEDLYPQNDVAAQHTHHGWPAPSVLPARPWNRDDKLSLKPGNWVSRRMVVRRWTITLQPENLKPTPEFVKAMADALAKPESERMQACREVIGLWGEWIPTAAVIGASLSATGILAVGQSLTGGSTWRRAKGDFDIVRMIDQSLGITGSFEKRLASRIQGGRPEKFVTSGFKDWMKETVNINSSSTWQVVKVQRAVLVTDCLPEGMRHKIDQLFLNSKPPPLVKPPFRTPPVGSSLSSNFDGNPKVAKDIQRVDIWYNQTTVQDILIAYVDGAESGPYDYGKGKMQNASFTLAKGEFITDVYVWCNSTDIKSIQFAKNTAQISPIYGAKNGLGEGYIMSGEGYALSGLAGRVSSQNLVRLQASWRVDVLEPKYRRIATSITKHTISSNMFNDYEFIGEPSTSRISQIRYGTDPTPNVTVCLFQTTYSSRRDGKVVIRETPIRGPHPVNLTDVWTLAEGEYITKVNGKANETALCLLEFTTNRGRKMTCGKSLGEPFSFEPPDANMALYYILGRENSAYRGVQGMTFVWGTIPA